MVWTSVLPSFLASIVESVEALTIVLVIGATVNWKSSLLGAGAAILSLSTLVVIMGSILVFVPSRVLQLVIGTTLIVFGLQWLKNAVLRYSKLKDKHDETTIYIRKMVDIKSQEISISDDFNNFGFFTSFKSVLYKGLQVAFIIITLSSTSVNIKINGISAASIGAILAFIIILILSLLVRTPLTKVPENTLKYIVSIVLMAFGTFLVGEGLNIEWIFHNSSLIILIVFFLLLSLMTITWLKTYNIKDTDVKQSLEDK
jgi:Ca2+/H+ antiporter, TMEM165/GDT1 family